MRQRLHALQPSRPGPPLSFLMRTIVLRRVAFKGIPCCTRCSTLTFYFFLTIVDSNAKVYPLEEDRLILVIRGVIFDCSG